MIGGVDPWESGEPRLVYYYNENVALEPVLCLHNKSGSIVPLTNMSMVSAVLETTSSLGVQTYKKWRLYVTRGCNSKMLALNT